jgi:hypothetical protein
VFARRLSCSVIVLRSAGLWTQPSQQAADTGVGTVQCSALLRCYHRRQSVSPDGLCIVFINRGIGPLMTLTVLTPGGCRRVSPHSRRSVKADSCISFPNRLLSFSHSVSCCCRSCNLEWRPQVAPLNTTPSRRLSRLLSAAAATTTTTTTTTTRVQDTALKACDAFFKTSRPNGTECPQWVPETLSRG